MFCTTDEILNNANGLESGMQQAGLKFMRIGIDSQNNIDSLTVLTVDGSALTFSSTETTLDLISASPSKIEGFAELDGPREDEI